LPPTGDGGRTVKLQQLKKYENEYKIKKEDF
jgi:hypothetical protein